MIAVDLTAFEGPYAHGGVSLYMQEVLLRMASERRVPLTCIGRKLDPSLSSFCEAIDLGCRTTQHRGLWWRDKLAGELRHEGFTGIWYPTQFTAWKHRLRSATTLHDFAGLSCSSRSRLKTRAYMAVSLLGALSQSESIISISKATSEELVRRFPSWSKKSSLAIHGLPSDVAGAAPRLLAQGKSNSAPLRHLFLDGGNSRKRLDLSLQALARIGWEGRELRITGNVAACEARVLSVCGTIPNNVTFLGKLDRSDLLIEIHGSDILQYISDFEGFGFPILEAGALETTVVILPGAAELEVGGKSVIAAKDYSVESLIQSILNAEEAARDQGWRDSIRIHANSFTWDESVRIHTEVLGRFIK